MEENQQNTPLRRDTNKIYFLIAVIVALLGTNAYLFFKDKKQSERYVTVSTEKDKLQLEVEKIEVELDKVNSMNVNLNDNLKKEQDMAREKIAQLKTALKKGQLTHGELVKAQKEVQELREFVKNYNEQIEKLQKENTVLKGERDSLKTTVSQVSEKATNLEKQNQDLSTKVKAGAALKAASISVLALKVKNSGKEVDVTRASTTKKLRIGFGLAPNSLAEKGMHDVYLRVIDPAGNLIANDGDVFEADGQQLQYTYHTSIEHTGEEGKVFNLDWPNAAPFVKGTYTLLLYCDGYTMGKTSITLR